MLVQRYNRSADTSVRLQQVDEISTKSPPLRVLLSGRAAFLDPHTASYLGIRLQR